MFEIQPEWTAVPDMMITEPAIKRRGDEVARGWRKRQKEDDIHPEKHENSPTVSWRA